MKELRKTKAIIVICSLCLLVGVVVVAGCGVSADTGAGDGSQCLECGSGEVIPIEYGLPGKEMSDRAERGEILLGGCVVSEDSPVWHCKDCGHQWGRFGDTHPDL